MMGRHGMAGLVDRWQRGEAPAPEELKEAGRHIDSCSACRCSYGTLLPLMGRDAGLAPAATPPSGLEERIMGVVLGEGMPRAARPARRAWMIAVAAAIVLVVGISGGILLRAGIAPRDSRVTVAFVVDFPEARSVALVGDFTGWQSKGYELQRRPSDGKWVITLRLQPDRAYLYSFLVDGEVWSTDPTAGTVDDGFGGTDSILQL